MLQGLTSARNTFQRFINEVTRGLSLVDVCIDDSSVLLKNEKKHFTHLAVLLKRLMQYGIILNKDNCVFCSLKIEFWGHEVCKEGLHSPLKEK